MYMYVCFFCEHPFISLSNIQHTCKVTINDCMFYIMADSREEWQFVKFVLDWWSKAHSIKGILISIIKVHVPLIMLILKHCLLNNIITARSPVWPLLINKFTFFCARRLWNQKQKIAILGFWLDNMCTQNNVNCMQFIRSGHTFGLLA